MIVRASRKLYKPGEISTQAERSRKAGRFYRKMASSPLCACISAISDPLIIYSYVHFRMIKGKEKEVDYIFKQEAVLSFFAVYNKTMKIF